MITTIEMLVKKLFICILSRNFKNGDIFASCWCQDDFSSSSFCTGSSPIPLPDLKKERLFKWYKRGTFDKLKSYLHRVK